MPKPRPYETKDEYISRCTAIVINEGKSPDQAYEKAIKQYKQDNNG